eukprot:TRINITY_DN9099_c1_g5_i1.p1 TRINITY_DN9099_c1_g5~~TRINITY_DN9099_c1_g5_i1.p1  ORF type:complete len:337 (+),score=86.53 TRINITY_DN9099_c1_g5_i1:94-1104(+)
MSLRRTVVSAVAAMTMADAMVCPGSPSFLHASAKVEALASTSCAEVKAEMLGRVAAQASQQWEDPHNKGTYKVISGAEDADQLEFSRLTGNKQYTDKMTFTFQDEDGTCKISGCSESQVFSVADFSTNYCNLRNLYCGSADGCKPVKNDFAVNETWVLPSVGAGKDPSKCIVAQTPTLRGEVFAAEKKVTQSYGDEALGCVADNCPLDPHSLMPSISCVLANCTSKLTKCIFHTTCRQELFCESKCSAPITNTDDAPKFQRVTDCVRVHCPVFPVSKTCAAVHCADHAIACGMHKKCRAALECSNTCLPREGKKQALKLALEAMEAYEREKSTIAV